MKYILALIIGIILALLLPRWIKKRVMESLIKKLENQDYDNFFKQLDSLLCKCLFTPYQRESVRLNAFSLTKKEKEYESQLELLMKVSIEKRQQLNTLMISYSYYLQKKDAAKCQSLLTSIQEIGDANLAHNCEIQYSVIIKEETIYLNECKQRLKNANSQDKHNLYYLLSLMYHYQGNYEKEKEYLNLIKKII